MRGGRPGSYSADPEFAGRAAEGQDPKCREALGLVRERRRHRDAFLSRREGGLVECAEGVLRARAPARVESLTVHLPLRGVHTSRRLDGWLGAAATPSLRVLVVDLLEVLGVEKQWREPGEPYWFPCHLLSAGRAPSLVHLRLKFLALAPPPRLPALLRTSLRGLDLDMVRVTDSGLLGALNGCPLLQRLRLTRCDELATLRLHGGLLPRLRVLVVEDCCRLRKMVLSGSPLALLVLRYKGHRIQFAAAEGESAAAADLLAWPFPRYLHYFSN